MRPKDQRQHEVNHYRRAGFKSIKKFLPWCLISVSVMRGELYHPDVSDGNNHINDYRGDVREHNKSTDGSRDRGVLFYG